MNHIGEQVGKDSRPADARLLDDISQRNARRLDQIDAALNELRPLVAKLERERSDVVGVLMRTNGPIAADGCSDAPATTGCKAASQTPTQWP